MRILQYGSERDMKLVASAVREHSLLASKMQMHDSYNDFDEFLDALSSGRYNLVIVTADNAEGMESVIAAKKCFPDIPVVWFSNDRGFGAQSYRLGCSYFGVRPITKGKVHKAILRSAM